MLVDKKIPEKIQNIIKRYTKIRYEKLMDIPVEMLETYEHTIAEPPENVGGWKPAVPGTKWGGSWKTAWFRADIILPEVCAEKKIFVRAITGGDSLFIANGVHKGVFDRNHSVVMLDKKGLEGKKYHLAFESYSGHDIPGCGPDECNDPLKDGCSEFEGVELLLEREDVSEFIFDLLALAQLAEAMDINSLRRNKIFKALEKIFAVVDAVPDETGECSWRPKLAAAAAEIKPLLEEKNSKTTPFFGIIGHSHIDTAWLWPISETWRKCARTFSSVLNLIEQYPEFIFVQSSPYQTSVIRNRYPEIYERIKENVKKGSWEPNGAMWVEPDCNIPSGEALVRQLLIGQTATREMFGYTSDTLWLPDVFGYSAALPQIMRGCGVEFFCTTKLAWNDTNCFPYDTFIWKGIDGSAITAHLHNLECTPDPKTLIEQWKNVRHKDVQDRRLIAVGHGDGGGGPTAEMIEISRRTVDLEGCPRAVHTNVSDFMKGIRDELKELPEWHGELYLELHRGTLTSISEIKRANRKTETEMRNSELIWTLQSVLNGSIYPLSEFNELWKTLLVNQFHDILPGSSIAEVNDEAMEAFTKCRQGIESLSRAALRELVSSCGIDSYETGVQFIAVVNSLNWTRKNFIIENIPEDLYPEGENIKAQVIRDVEGKRKLAVAGAAVHGLGISVLKLVPGGALSKTKSPFRYSADLLDTPTSIVKFDKTGGIISFIDKVSGRDIIKLGSRSNSFLLGEDVPEYWDNWDIDRDQSLKLKLEDELISREVTEDGPVQFRIRSCYKIGTSTMWQDMVFYADTPQVDFETVVEWHEKHKLLKVEFHFDIFTESTRQEIQYGYVERPTHKNLSQDRARFEVCNHKWTDLSEAEFGVAVLNDCKYGISVEGSQVRLSLLKSGLRPDPRGDEGRHSFTYSILPHACAFSVEAVIRPAYELNVPIVSVLSQTAVKSFSELAAFDCANIIVESIKWAENGAGFILRFYDALKTGRNVNLRFGIPVKTVYETNLLEEVKTEIRMDQNSLNLFVKPFEIKTLLCII